MIASQQVFRDIVINLDGGSFVDCKFERCEIRISGILPIHLERPQFVDCRWHFYGPALTTIEFMTAMHRAGATDLIEKTCAGILSAPAQAAPVAPLPLTPAAKTPKKKLAMAAKTERRSAAPSTKH